MSRGRLGAFLLIVAGFALLSRWVGDAPLAPPPLPANLVADTGAPVADFTLPDLQGRARSSVEWRGRLVLLNFWATWCAPCREELPSLEALHRALSSEGLAVVAVSLDGAAGDRVARFVADAGVTFPMLHDPSRSLADRLGVRVYPTSVLLDRGGRVLRVVESAWDWAHPDTQDRLRTLLAN